MNLKNFLDTPPWEWPRNSAKLFHDVLIDTQAKESDRILAAELAGDFTVINDKLSSALLEIVGSATEPVELRVASAIALGAVLEHADTVGFEDPEDVPITERAFRKIQDSLHKFYVNESNPSDVRRKILEAAVRAPQDWQENAIRKAYISGDPHWKRTAVFAMQHVRGFDAQILEALKSPDAAIQRHAVEAAGNWEIDAAWQHVAALVRDGRTPKPLLIAAIGAAGSIRPQAARDILIELVDSDDEDIVEAADEALMMAEGALQMANDDEEAGDKWIN